MANARSRSRPGRRRARGRGSTRTGKVSALADLAEKRRAGIKTIRAFPTNLSISLNFFHLPAAIGQISNVHHWRETVGLPRQDFVVPACSARQGRHSSDKRFSLSVAMVFL